MSSHSQRDSARNARQAGVQNAAKSNLNLKSVIPDRRCRWDPELLIGILPQPQIGLLPRIARNSIANLSGTALTRTGTVSRDASARQSIFSLGTRGILQCHPAYDIMVISYYSGIVRSTSYRAMHVKEPGPSFAT